MSERENSALRVFLFFLFFCTFGLPLTSGERFQRRAVGRSWVGRISVEARWLEAVASVSHIGRDGSSLSNASQLGGFSHLTPSDKISLGMCTFLQLVNIQKCLENSVYELIKRHLCVNFVEICK